MLDSAPPPVLLAALLVMPFGLVLGSFANVVIHRLPIGESIAFPPSRCPKCRTAIRPWHNVPVLSWLFLQGRCASCQEPISVRYPVVEGIHGLGFALVVLRFGLQPFTPLALALFFSLVVLAFIDWDHQILPDVMTLPGILVGILGSLAPGSLVTWRSAILAAVLGYVAFFGVAEAYARLRGVEGLGQGDWKLAAMLGAFLGGQRLMLVVFLGSVTGMVYGLVQGSRLRRAALTQGSQTEGAAGEDELLPVGKYKLPFGTFLAASAIFVILFGDPVLAWYLSLFRV